MRRSDGLYQRRQYWYFKWKSKDGRWVERATRTRNYADAKHCRSAFLRDLDAGKLPNDRSCWTLQQAVHQWLEERKHRIAPGSYSSERTITKSLTRVLGGDTRLQKLADILVIRQYETARLERSLSAKTVNNEVAVLAGVLRSAKLWGRLQADYHRIPVEKSDIRQALSREEACRMIQLASHAHPDDVAPFTAVLSYATGMRSREIKSLQLGSIHLELGRPEVQVKRATTKTNRGARFVALDTMACWALRKLLNRAARLGANRSEHYLLPTLRDRHTRPNDPLHGGSGWDPAHPQSSWDAEWKRLCREARIAHRRFHDLRHSYITRAAEAGVPLMVVQAQVGHLSREMTEHYCHITAAAVHKAAQQIEQQSSDLLEQLGLGREAPETSLEVAPEKTNCDKSAAERREGGSVS
jgi:integrase